MHQICMYIYIVMLSALIMSQIITLQIKQYYLTNITYHGPESVTLSLDERGSYLD